MLLWLAIFLEQFYRGFSVFHYLTLRSILAALTAFAIMVLLGPWMIKNLQRYQIGQAIRDDGPQTHLIKAGTPTMGGVLILIAITISVLLWGNLADRYIWIVL